MKDLYTEKALSSSLDNHARAGASAADVGKDVEARNGRKEDWTEMNTI